jgi:hypothetical protein
MAPSSLFFSSYPPPKPNSGPPPILPIPVHFRTIYDVFRYMDQYDDIKNGGYDHDLINTAYTIPYSVWLHNTRIDKKRIQRINAELTQGDIHISRDEVILSYDRVCC